jgi:polyribonucleotide nucleotidyltransferase
MNEIRPIWSEVDYLPTAHGSAVFTRGETQSLTTVTLGTKLDEQMIDSAMISGTNKFMLHYNFPAFSTGEARPNRGPGRREVGHGNLGHAGTKESVAFSADENPYTLRVVSDIWSQTVLLPWQQYAPAHLRLWMQVSKLKHL